MQADELGHRGVGLDHLAQPRLHLGRGGLTDQERVVLDGEEDRDADQDEADEARGGRVPGGDARRLGQGWRSLFTVSQSENAPPTLNSIIATTKAQK
jgi:hypothetical protein